MREWRMLLLGLFAIVLAGCSGTANMGSILSDTPQEQQAEPLAPLKADGGRKVALLLPLSGKGTEGMALALKQAAELAAADAGGGSLTFLTEDTGGTAAGAKVAAEKAVAAGAELILGPLLSGEVQAVTPIAEKAGINVIAFSSVSTVAAPGTYLMSFLPDQEISAVLRYATAQGYRNVAALYPKSQYGGIVSEAALTGAAAYGASISPAGRYAREAPQSSPDIARIATALQQGGSEQALLLPEGGEALRALGTSLESQGVASSGIKVIGTGLWDDEIAPTVPLVQGGWYAGVSPDLVTSFDNHYAKSYGSKPPRIASLAYDAATLAVAMAKSGNFSRQAITSAGGYQGQNGLFRFKPSGQIERSLSILEMSSSGPREIAPASEKFNAGS